MRPRVTSGDSDRESSADGIAHAAMADAPEMLWSTAPHRHRSGAHVYVESVRSEIPATTSLRIAWVDVAKGIGIILVVYGHAARGVFDAGAAFDEGLHMRADSIVYSFHMPLFFFVAGLFAERSLARRGTRTFVANKIDSLVYVYVFWAILQGTILVSVSSFTNYEHRLTDLLMVPVQPVAQFWFLYALFLSFVIHAAVESRLGARAAPLLFAVGGLLYLFPADIPWLTINELQGQMVFFEIGVLLSRTEFVMWRANVAAAGVMLTLFAFSEWLFHQSGYRYDDAPRGLAFVLAAIGIGTVATVSMSAREPIRRLLAFLGANSLEIYAMHILAAAGVRIGLMRVIGVSDPYILISVSVSVSVGLIAPLIVAVVARRLGVPWILVPPRWLSAEARAERPAPRGVARLDLDEDL